MKKLIGFLTTFFIAAIMLVNASYAAEESTDQTKGKLIEFKEQTVCPVMGGKINKDIYTDIQGQRVYHCCAGCKEPMETEPDKYFKKAAEEGVLFENIQTGCPISGKPVNKDVSIYHEGRTVYFCCDGCISMFEKEPQKYLSMLDAPKNKDKKMDMSHQGEKGKKMKMYHPGDKDEKMDMPHQDSNDDKGNNK